MLNKKNDITEVVENYLCHSCGSCDTICSHDSISFKITNGGYLFPKINYDTCTNCGLCYDVCPGNSFIKNLDSVDPFIGKIHSAISTKAVNQDIYNNSQSGGSTTAIIKYLFDFNLISVAVVTIMDGKNESKVKLIKSVDELSQSQKSKYIPTSLNNIIPELLKINGNIAFVGLSCHIEGLENLLKYKKKLSDRILKIGLICDRVLVKNSVDFFTKKMTNNEIKRFTFRDKINTGYPGDMTCIDNDDKLHKLSKTERILMKNFFTPLRCRLCFDKLNVYSDITIGDPHGISNIDKNGESLIMIRTEKGLKIVKDSIKNNYIKSQEVNIKDAIKGQDIEGKKKDFSAYYLAWKQMDKKSPKYPSNIEKDILKVSTKTIKKAKSDLKLSMLLDTFITKDDFMDFTEKYYKKEMFKFKIIKFLSKIKKIIKGNKNVN